MNLIPQSSPETGAYYCTWGTQARIRPMSMGDDSLDVRNGLTEDFLFGENGVLGNYFEGIRGDLIALLDDGWDVPLGTNNPADRCKFGSLELDTVRFPSFIGTPTERLKALADKIRSLGYKGTGLWIACQTPFDPKDPPLPDSEAAAADRPYWEKCAKLCNDVGIAYWKVDWGVHSGSIEYREMMTECVRKFAPMLKIEHYPSGMFPPFGKYRYGVDNFSDGELEYNRRIFAASDYIRTYDVLGEFKNAITLNRAAMLLDTVKNGAILNVEDSLYLGAGLGCSVGIMRHLRFEPGRERRNTTRCSEVVRAVRWQRIAPPFSGGEHLISDETLTDSHSYPIREPDLWPYVSGKTLESSAPAAVSRGCELATVELSDASGVKPFVICSKHPTSGAFSVAALNRTASDKILEYFRADVTAGIAEADKPIGIFGCFASLTLRLDRIVTDKRVFAQDLAETEAVDITARITIDGDRLVLAGELIDSLCKGHDDGSAPGIVLAVL